MQNPILFCVYDIAIFLWSFPQISLSISWSETSKTHWTKKTYGFTFLQFSHFKLKTCNCEILPLMKVSLWSQHLSPNKHNWESDEKSPWGGSSPSKHVIDGLSILDSKTLKNFCIWAQALSLAADLLRTKRKKSGKKSFCRGRVSIRQ